MKTALLVLTFVAAVSPAAFATDGVIEINQARALAGEVTVGDTPGFPITITETGSYRLTSNLELGNAQEGITVLAGDVTIDLNGFAIIGSGLPTSVAILGQIGANVTVVNGTIRGVNVGVDLATNGARVERVRVSDVSGTAISVGSDAFVSGCLVRRAGGRGIQIRRGLVTGNVVMDTGGPALYVINAAGYSDNAWNNNTGGYVVGNGLALGGNLCGAARCP